MLQSDVKKHLIQLPRTMATVCITGASRGIGFELARQLTDLPTSRISTVFVTTRSEPSQQLQDLLAASKGRVVNILCKVSDDASVNDAAKSMEKHLAGKGLDILVNNIGVRSASSIEQTIGPTDCQC